MIHLISYSLSCIGSLLILAHGGLETNHLASVVPTSIRPLGIELGLFHQDIQTSDTFTTPPQQVSITDLLHRGQDYHQHLISIQGLITQPELHLDESELFLNFVFRLSQGKHSLIVYGQHDRTLGAPAIRMNRTVHVVGIFRKTQIRNGETILNTIEAISVVPYPPSIPRST